jgi:hypothetical protein
MKFRFSYSVSTDLFLERAHFQCCAWASCWPLEACVSCTWSEWHLLRNTKGTRSKCRSLIADYLSCFRGNDGKALAPVPEVARRHREGTLTRFSLSADPFLMLHFSHLNTVWEKRVVILFAMFGYWWYAQECTCPYLLFVFKQLKDDEEKGLNRWGKDINPKNYTREMINMTSVAIQPDPRLWVPVIVQMRSLSNQPQPTIDKDVRCSTELHKLQCKTILSYSCSAHLLSFWGIGQPQFALKLLTHVQFSR